MKRISLLLIISLFAFALRAQNLVPNPSFEVMVACPDGDSQIDSANAWVSTRLTPDYFNTCTALESLVSIPSNFFGYQYPSSGNAYAGFWVNEGNLQPIWREHLGTSLISNLQVGTRYFVSLKVNLAPDNGGSLQYCGTNKIGVLFSTIHYNYSDTSISPIRNYAQIYTDSIIIDTLNWVTIRGSFIADSNYSFISIGNFFSDSLVSFINLAGVPCHSYYYVDDVCVSPDSAFAYNYTYTDIETIRNDFIASSFPNPFSNQITFSLADNEQTTVSLYNFLGQQVLEQTFTNSTTINTEQLADGIYFYELRRNKGTLKTGKVVKL